MTEDLDLDLDLNAYDTTGSEPQPNKGTGLVITSEDPVQGNTEEIFAAHRRDFEAVRDDHPINQLISWENFRAMSQGENSFFITARIDEELAGYALVINDLSLAPYISEEYFAKTYPDLFPEGIYYVACLGIKQQTSLYTFKGIAELMWDISATGDFIYVFDARSANTASKLARVLGLWRRDVGRFDVDLIGSQEIFSLDATNRTSRTTEKPTSTIY